MKNLEIGQIVNTFGIKGFVKVNLKKCKNCPKYQPRKTKKIKESFKAKKQKDKDRHDKWN